MQNLLSGAWDTVWGILQNKIKFWFCVFILTKMGVLHAIAQEPQKVWFAEGYLQKGFILPQQSHYYYMVRDFTTAANLMVGIQPDGTKKYDRDHFYINRGFGLHYINFGSPQIFGEAYSTYMFFQFRLKKTPVTERRFHFSLGLAWVTRPFDQYNNMYNMAIGSHINWFVTSSYDYYVRLFSRNYLLLSGGITHYSNGKFTVPNLGINSIGWRLGYKYVWNDENYKVVPRDTLPFKPYFSYQWGGGVGLKEELPVDNPPYTNFTTEFHVNRFVSPNHAWGLGVEANFEKSAQYRIYSSTGEWVDVGRYFQLATFINHTFRFGKLDFITQLSFYLHNNAPVLSRVMYNKVIMQYRFYKGAYAYFSLKVHYVEADYFSTGIGYHFEPNQ